MQKEGIKAGKRGVCAVYSHGECGVVPVHTAIAHRTTIESNPLVMALALELFLENTELQENC